MSLLANLTLQKRITLLVLAGLAIGLGLFSWLGIQSVNESVKRTLDERLTIARVIASHLDETLAYVLVQLQYVNFDDGLPSEEQFAPAVAPLRTTLAKAGILLPNVMLVDDKGKIIRVEPKDSSIIGTDMSRYPEITQTLNTGQPTISNLVSSLLVARPVVFASVPITDREGKILGVLIGSINVEQSSNKAFEPAITVGNTGYTEIVDGNGIILTRSRPGSPAASFEMSDHPGRFAELISQRQATVGTCHRCHETQTTFERRRDVLALAPLNAATWGVAIRQSEEEALAPTRQLEQRLILLGIIVLTSAFLLVWIMMQGIVKPVKLLTAAAKRVATGDFKAAIPVKRQDEVGQLSTAFYDMTQELAKSREELLLRSEELSALNAIAVTVSQSLNLKDVLEKAMEKVLEVTKTTSGCVFLRHSDDNRLQMMNRIGPSKVFDCQNLLYPSANCACYQLLREGETLMVNDVSQCPMLGEKIIKEEGINYFVSVPLKSKDRTLGIMNIACPESRHFTEHDFRILDAISYHVGLAIENSTLYEDAKQKEKLRGQLLSSVINAQEEERKRIARELHDEYGQSLTGLIMSIESLENTILPEQEQQKEKLKSIKSLVVHALQDIRKLTLDLRPSTLDDLGLVAAIRSYAQTNLENAGIQVNFQSKGLKGRLSPPVETALFRIVQEAVHNITKYADARNVSIQLENKDGKITAIVEDDGNGFDVRTVLGTGSETRSLGLRGIKERATLLGGTFSIKSQVGKGTRLMVQIPIDGSPAQPDLTRTGTSSDGQDKIQGAR